MKRNVYYILLVIELCVVTLPYEGQGKTPDAHMLSKKSELNEVEGAQNAHFVSVPLKKTKCKFRLPKRCRRKRCSCRIVLQPYGIWRGLNARCLVKVRCQVIFQRTCPLGCRINCKKRCQSLKWARRRLAKACSIVGRPRCTMSCRWLVRKLCCRRGCRYFRRRLCRIRCLSSTCVKRNCYKVVNVC